MPAWLLLFVPGGLTAFGVLSTALFSCIYILVTYFIMRVGWKLAFKMAIFLLFFALLTSLFATIQGLYDTISVSMPPSFQAASDFFLPANLTACLTVLVTTRVTIWFWHWKTHYLEKMSDVL